MAEALPRPLTKEETKQYFLLFSEGDYSARNKLIEHNLRLVLSIAYKFVTPLITIDDLQSIGTIGLIKAVNTFDINKGNTFATYASRCIENEILMYLRKNSKYDQQLSLDEPIELKDNDDLTLGDRIEDQTVNVQEEIENKLLYQELYRYVSVLDEQSFQIISMLYGLNGNERQSQTEVADKLGISRSHVSRLHKQILFNMKKDMQAKSLQKMLEENHIYDLFCNISFEQFISLYGDQYLNLNETTQTNIALFYNHFDLTKENLPTLRELETKINLRAFPFLTASAKFGNNKYISIYQTYKDQFTIYQQKVIEHYLFKKPTLDELVNEYKYTKTSFSPIWLFSKIKLESLFFNIEPKDLNKQTVINILNNPSYNISEFHRLILSMHRGIGYDKEYDVKEIADNLNMPIVSIHDSLMYIEEKLYELLYGVSSYGERKDNSDFKEYINSIKYDFNPQTRSILRDYIIADKSYDSLAQQYGLSKYQISNIITEGIRRINFYKYKIINDVYVDESDLESFFKNNNYSEEIKNIIVDCYINKIDLGDIAKKTKMCIDTINYYIHEFEINFIKHKFGDYCLDEEDYLKEFNISINERILDKKELEFISLLKGIKTEYNIDGKVYNKEEIMRYLSIKNNRSYNKTDHNVKWKLMKRKAGFLNADFGIIPKSEIEPILKDSRLPLSDKEIEILKNLYEIDGYFCSEPIDLAKKFNMSKNSLLRRYQRAILSIKQYQANEIEGKYDYEKDILPNLRYFPKDYRSVIEAKYKNGYTAEQITESTNDTIHQVRHKLRNIKIQLASIIQNNQNIIKLDYDEMERLVNNEDLVIFGKRNIKLKAFNMYYGLNGYQRYTIPQIIETLKLENSTSILSKHIKDVLLSIEKYKIGIKKNSWFNCEQLINYYEANKNNLSKKEKMQIKDYLKKENNESRNDLQTVFAYHSLPLTIRYNLACYLFGKTIDFEKMNEQEIIKFLKTKNQTLNLEEYFIIATHFGIHTREIMHNSDKMKVLKIMIKMYYAKQSRKENSYEPEKVKIKIKTINT